MKKLIYLLLFLPFVFQAQVQNNLKLGLKAGANMSTVSGDDLDASFKFGYHIGGFAELEINEKLSFVPEMIFMIKGYENSESGGGEDSILSEGVTIDQDLELSYLIFPLMTRFNFNESFFVEAGPQIGFLMGARFKNTETIRVEFPGVDEDGESITLVEESSEVSDLNVRNEFENIDFGINVGLGGYITENIMFSARYYLGLNNIDAFNRGFSNQVIMLSMGYRF